MIVVENLTKGFGSQVLFEGVNFKINARERVGLVGRNGHGKTTFFRLLSGDEHPEKGALRVPKHYRIGHISQHLDFKKDTVLEEGMRGLSSHDKDLSWKVEKILSGLGFSQKQMQLHPSEFSGGYQVRMNLAKVLVSEPNLLLLDEPTNYLDITAIRWMERFLQNWPSELILVTHDRSLMDNIATHIVGIHRKKMRKITGNTGKYYAQIAQDEEVYEKTRMNDQRRQKEIELFISRFRAKARLANMVQSRIKTLAKLEKKDKLVAASNLDFSFKSKPFKGKFVMGTKDISFSYNPEIPLIKDFNINIGAHDRICIVGKNGKGKTTLLKLLAKVLSPKSGQINSLPNVTHGFFEQTNVKSLVDDRTVEEEILYAHNDVDRQIARNISGAMMFEGDNALKKVRVLSGGEKSRVMLGKILVTPVNLLLLDEPSNHLDMESCDSLLAALDSFTGAMVMVTHNEMFLHALAKRLIVFKDEEIFLFEGSYQRFLEKGGWEDEDKSPKLTEQDGTSEKQDRKSIRKKRSKIIANKSKVLKPIKKQITKVENHIENLEKDLDRLNKDMQDASQAGDGIKISELSKSIHDSQTTINDLFDNLEQLTNNLEKQEALFEKEIAQLE